MCSNSDCIESTCPALNNMGMKDHGDVCAIYANNNCKVKCATDGGYVTLNSFFYVFDSETTRLLLCSSLVISFEDSDT